MIYRRRRYYKKYYKRKYKKRYRKKAKKPINNSSRSRATIKATKHELISLIVPGGGSGSAVHAINPVCIQTDPTVGKLSYNVCEFSTLDDPLVVAFSKYYEEFKIEGVYVNVTVTTPVVAGAAGFNALRVYTAWDRCGTYNDLYYYNDYPTLSRLKEMASCKAVTISNNSGTSFGRYVKASDLIEKNTWHDCTQKNTIGLQFCTGSASDADPTVHTCCVFEAWANANNAWTGFCPCFYICAEPIYYVPSAAFAIACAIDYTVYYTFRNPMGHGGSSVLSSSVQKTVTVSSPGKTPLRIKVPVTRALDLEEAEAEGMILAKKLPRSEGIVDGDVVQAVVASYENPTGEFDLNITGDGMLAELKKEIEDN